ncbi:MAG: GNAT family N-acetyltransferase [Firmicutes bacterium]|jgi:ribosomal-protein-serine acetyltransferase|nr:GNAT family N-acetyltransferase [Bacillota bacterium]
MFTYRVDENIVLKLVDMRDLDIFHGMCVRNYEHLKKWMSWVEVDTPKSKVENFIKGCMRQFADGLGVQCTVYYKGQVCGIIGHNDMNTMHKFVSIGYWLDEDYTGKGIMTKVCKALIDMTFEDYEIHRIEIRTATENNKSYAIPERLGFVKEGTIRQVELVRGNYYDHYVYGMLREDWKKLND